MKEKEDQKRMKGLSGFFADRPKLNISIDIILFILLMAMAGLGLLIKYNLVNGETRNILYGTNVDLEFLGLDRHQWGTIHLITSLAFVFFIILHIIFHWKIINCYFARLFPGKFTRTLIGIIIALLGITMFLFSFVVKPDQIERARNYQNRRGRLKEVGALFMPNLQNKYLTNNNVFI